SAKRFHRLPEIPTFAESGLPGFESTGWFGFVVPAGTPAGTIATLNAAVFAVLKNPDAVERFRAPGARPVPQTPAGFSAFVPSEIDKWLKVMAVGSGQPN